MLYPNDSFEQGRELRLKQEYFFVACSIHDIVWRYSKQHKDFSRFSEKVAIQLNDTHPAVAIAELMRVLVDEHRMEWEEAWRQTVAAFGYTNHTLLPEALERWPVSLFQRLLPRHFEIVQEINRRFLREVMAFFPHSPSHVGRMSIISDGHGHEREVRMANLAVVGSHSINGVARLHTDLIKSHLLKDFCELYPERFNNKTNGVTLRRWLYECNPALSSLITETLGDDGWVTDHRRLAALEPAVDEAEFRSRVRAIKLENKLELSKLVFSLVKQRIDPHSIFDVQIKRLHEYKRQHLAALYAITLYLRAKRGENVHPRTFLFGAKAAPGIPSREAHHQAHPLHRGHHQPGQAAERRPRRLHAELPRLARRAHHPGGRSLGADLHRWHGGLRHREHEAGDERRADDRHPRRREHRDPRGGRGGQLLPLRARRRSGPRAPP